MADQYIAHYKFRAVLLAAAACHVMLFCLAVLARRHVSSSLSPAHCRPSIGRQNLLTSRQPRYRLALQSASLRTDSPARRRVSIGGVGRFAHRRPSVDRQLYRWRSQDKRHLNAVRHERTKTFQKC